MSSHRDRTQLAGLEDEVPEEERGDFDSLLQSGLDPIGVCLDGVHRGLP